MRSFEQYEDNLVMLHDLEKITSLKENMPTMQKGVI
jgi:hypothetical protein